MSSSYPRGLSLEWLPILLAFPLTPCEAFSNFCSLLFYFCPVISSALAAFMYLLFSPYLQFLILSVVKPPVISVLSLALGGWIWQNPEQIKIPLEHAAWRGRLFYQIVLLDVQEPPWDLLKLFNGRNNYSDGLKKILGPTRKHSGKKMNHAVHLDYSLCWTDHFWNEVPTIPNLSCFLNDHK